MQTFLPYPDLAASMAVLDDKRLGKQRVETLQVMKAVTVAGYGWQSHPVTRMWRGHRPALMEYQEATCAEWMRRGFADTCFEKTLAIIAEVPEDLAAYTEGRITRPPWWGRPELHLSHRSKLLAKAPELYRPAFPGDPDDLDYVWPVASA
ncbi:MSMEG_6728 family protein [Clavibacter capsici]|uniref:MSMEG_6728 family protein n=1 Tax=Clavibacter capsici TaxID=1874630 RepID=UPI0014286531|nr:MSMEG_6728 family protein [Clavibacter capsici]QIS38083.1 hypothetical protein GW572_01005 [Clavibacter capsici]